MSQLATIWIVDRDPRRRAALARLAGSEHQAVLGAPEDPLFNSAALPGVVVVGLSSDFEAELDFVHRLRARVGDCGWILISLAGDSDELKRLFDTLDARVLSWPPLATELRREIRSLHRVRAAAPLSQRTGRESLSARFARWFSGDELEWLLRTLDPSLASVPFLARGDAGTGRRLLAHYIHAFGSEPSAALVPVFCEGVQTAGQLLSQLDVVGLQASGPSPIAMTIWLDEVDRLPPAIQRQLHDWIEFGLPRGTGLSQPRIRWTASAGEEAAAHPGRQLEPGLEQALCGLVIHLAPLREQPTRIERFVRDTAAAWCHERKSRPREFDPEALQTLALYPWPGNLSELESVVIRTLASSASATITADELRFDAGGEPAATRPFAAEQQAEEGALPNAVLAPDPAPTAGELLGSRRIPVRDEIAVEAELEPHEVALRENSPGGEVENSRATPVEEPAATPDDSSAAPTDIPAVSDAALSDASWTHILRSVAHEVRNPLVSIRTFSELLPEHYEDSEFRARFSELVGADVRRIEEVVTRLQDLSELSHAKRQPVDIASLLDELLEERRAVVEARGLLVLKELDHGHPIVLGDAPLLRGAFGGILNRALEWVPERGDLYLASQHRSQPGADATLRILLRYQGTSATGQPISTGPAPTLAESTLEFVAARTVITALGGALTIGESDLKTVIIVDLPAAPPSSPV